MIWKANFWLLIISMMAAKGKGEVERRLNGRCFLSRKVLFSDIKPQAGQETKYPVWKRHPASATTGEQAGGYD